MDINKDEAHTALLHNGKPVEYIRDNTRNIQGNIYLAKVEKVSKNFAFLNIGQPQRAFLKLKPTEKLKGGQTLVVQVKKSALNQGVEHKGPVVIRRTLENIQTDMQNAPALIYSENSGMPYKSTLLALLEQGDIDSIVINNESHLEQIAEISAPYNIQPRLFSGDIFGEYEVYRHIKGLSDKKVWLRSGGYIVIEKTSALTVIDVNTGKYTNKKADTSIKTNLEAANEIAKQLRLRNITGIIIVDFINTENKRSLLDHLRCQVKKDRTPTLVVGITSLGLVEITRKRGK